MGDNNENNPNTQAWADPAKALAQVTELAGGLAHELRNPLSTIKINLKLLAEDIETITEHPEDVRRRALIKLDTLMHEADRLQILFDDFLKLATPRTLDKKPADINQVIDRLVEFFTPLAHGKKITVDFRGASEALVCLIDERTLRQGLLNLLINAQQAMPDGGTLTIVTRRENDSARIDVQDTGVGIAHEDRDRVLRPFFSTKAEGNGLGLSITRRIVDEHGGRIAFQSELGVGTTFTITLPLARQAGTKKDDNSSTG